MSYPQMTRYRRLALALAFAPALILSAGAQAQTPPPVSPTLTPPTAAQPAIVAPLAPPAIVTLPPVPIPPLSPSQAAFLSNWLKQGAAQGLTARSTDTAALSGEALVNAVLDRARALHRGRVDTADFIEVWGVRPPAYDPTRPLAAAITADRLPQWANDLTPPYAGYDGLRKGLSFYEKIRDTGGWPLLSAQSAASIVRQRLAIEDKGVTDAEPLTAAIQRAQRRYGLNPTGLLDTRTLAALNVPVDDRIAAIMANMERWRWMPRDLPVNRVQVNIAAAVLTVFEGDAPVTSMRAVTGSPGNATPMLVSSIHSIVVNPPWNVPASIANRELFPKGRGTLLKQGYKILKTPEGGERIVQPAGPNSALGRLKFDFANNFAVYLHDTPLRGKFSSYDRLSSHGCVRLEKPVPLAELMVKGDPNLEGNIQTLIDQGKTQRLSLPREVAVYLLYWTAFANNDAAMSFRADPYGWDKLLADKIEASSRRAAAAILASKD
jgi:murein L,D-transpeptidase YcbB/YkuD